MSMAFEFPPVIGCRNHKEKSRYLRAQPRRRVNMLCDYAQSTRLENDDLLALGIESVREFFNGQLPPGCYRNDRGFWFRVTGSGELGRVQWSRPNGQRVWFAGQVPGIPPPQLPREMQFAPGEWRTQEGFPSFHHAAPQPRLGHRSPANFFYSASGPLFNHPTSPQQYPTSADQLQQHPARLAPAPLGPCVAAQQQHFGAAPAYEQPFLFPATGEQHQPRVFAGLGEISPFFTTFDEQHNLDAAPASREQPPLLVAVHDQPLSFRSAGKQPPLPVASLEQQYDATHFTHPGEQVLGAGAGQAPSTSENELIERIQSFLNEDKRATRMYEKRWAALEDKVMSSYPGYGLV
ncbi:uncharacterized protein M421DRAFT_88437 [Didymella exigua CBS 183.55]|uniref:Uncharacterized protein n=1 Tax=Didymella exigua CBS 183.55 TaxID=1150837 RepID=A0A6A5RZ77_9PLEO|nr:uncharacterized protein M421DRAFT_88437 [Didymella exigua CBS 183.55]KAF1933162.1 hypothetical protein M421DRAFT_88437 [Didymella exigua CBS 183.55]